MKFQLLEHSGTSLLAIWFLFGRRRVLLIRLNDHSPSHTGAGKWSW